MNAKLAGLLLLSLTAAACGGADEPSAPAGSGAGANGANGAAATSGEGTVQTGRYALTTQVDLTQVDGFKDKASDSLKPIQKLKSNPAQTFTDALSTKNPAAVSAVKDGVPSAVSSMVAGWMNEGADTSGLSGLSDNLTGMMGKVKVQSVLDLGKDAATHTITGVTMTDGLKDILVNAPDIVGAIKPASNILVDLKGAEATLGAHALSLPLGDLASKGLDLLNTDNLIKTGLKFALSQIIKCDDIAQSVSTKCIGPICVGHKTEIAALCDEGLDAVVDVTLLGMKELNIDPLKLLGGSITSAVPGGSAISGIFKGAVDLGKGEQAITSPFTGVKL